MLDINTIIKEFKLGGIERIFVCFYSYFIVGYLILFVIFKNSFINLDLSTQIFLSLAISFPIISIPAALETNQLKNPDNDGFFYMGTSYFYEASIFYTAMFSGYYILRILELIPFNVKMDSLVGVVIIVIYIIYVYFKTR